MALPPKNRMTLPGGMTQGTAVPPVFPQGRDPAVLNQAPDRDVETGMPSTQAAPVDLGTIGTVGPEGFTPPGQMTPEMDQAAQQVAQQQAQQVADQAMQQKYGSNLTGAAQLDLARAGRTIESAVAQNEATRASGNETAQAVRDLAQERATLETPIYDKAAGEMQTQQEWYKGQRERIQASVDKSQADLDAAVQEFSNTHITSWYDRADTGTKIFAVLATAFQSAAEAMQGKFGGTTALERITKEDMERQKLQMQLAEKKVSMKQTLLGSLRNQLGDMDSAMVAFQNIASNSIKFQAQAISAKLGTKEAEVKAKQIMQEQDDKINQRNLALKQQQTALRTTKAQMEENAAQQQRAEQIKLQLGIMKAQGKKPYLVSNFEGTENIDPVNRRKLATRIGAATTNITNLTTIEKLAQTDFAGMKPLEALAVLDTLATMHGLNYNMAKGLTRFADAEFQRLHDAIATMGAKVGAVTGWKLPFGVKESLIATVRLMRADLKSNVHNEATAWQGVRPKKGSIFDITPDDEALLASTAPTKGPEPESAAMYRQSFAEDDKQAERQTDDEE